MTRADWTIRVTVLMLLLAAAGIVRGDDTTGMDAPGETRFARIATDEQGHASALQLAIVSYRPSNGRYSVDLISAVHIGDKAYYAELNERFRGYDALLYELIGPPNARPSGQPSERAGLLSNSQLAMTHMLDLEFQLNEIDYGQPNLVHADLSPEELSESMADRGESLYVYFWRVFYASMEEYVRDPLGLRDLKLLTAMLSSDGQGALKLALAYEMTRIDRVRDALDGDSGSAIIGSRNERAIDVLSRQIDLGAERIGIFFGAAHMPDLERRLVHDLELSKYETSWIDAWDLDDPVPSD